MKARFTSRIRFVIAFVIIIPILIAGKLFLIQVVHSESYTQRAERQYVTPINSIFQRGNIYFSRKEGDHVSGATVISGFKVVANPKKILDIEKTYELLSQVITLDHDYFVTRMTSGGTSEKDISHKLSKEEADKVNALDIPGILTGRENWRFYPGGTLAANVLGFVGYKGDEFNGRYGLERYYEDVLSRDEYNPYVNFFAEVFTNISKRVFQENVRDGDIELTIESNVQAFLESELDNVMEKWKSESAGGIIIDPKTGEIYAMASRPTFNVNTFSEVDDISVFSNPLVDNIFELGSVIKPLVMSVAIETGVITPDTPFYDPGYVVVGNKRIENFDKKGRGSVTMTDVLAQSLNTGMVWISQNTPKETMRKYLLSFGLGERTGIDLPNETEGLVSNLNSKRDIEFATISFGQGIAVSPISAVRAFSALANGGQLITPHVVKTIDYSDGGKKEIVYDTGATVLKEETTRTITTMMTNVANGLDTVKLNEYTIAAKTGTAQVPNESGGYSEFKRLHSFFGYFPAYNPDFLVFLYTMYPKEVRYASQSVAPSFGKISKFLIQYYNIPPDRNAEGGIDL